MRTHAEVYAERFLDLGICWPLSDLLHAPAALPQGKNPRNPFDRGSVGPKTDLDRILDHTSNRTATPPSSSSQLVAIPMGSQYAQRKYGTYRQYLVPV
jgi:hypothetical protein